MCLILLFDVGFVLPAVVVPSIGGMHSGKKPKALKRKVRVQGISIAGERTQEDQLFPKQSSAVGVLAVLVRGPVVMCHSRRARVHV